MQSAINNTTFTFAFVSLLALALLLGVHLLSERNREQVHRHATWLRTTLGSIGDAVIASDGEGRVIFMNAVAEGLTAWSHDAARESRWIRFSGSQTRGLEQPSRVP